MYNRYVPEEEFAQVTPEEEPPHSQEHEQRPPEARHDQEYTRVDDHHNRSKGGHGEIPGLDALGLGRLGELFSGDQSGGVSRLLNSLRLDDLDSGDLLLLLIILFLLAEGDNLDLVITLGLMLIMGLGDKNKKEGYTGT